MRIVVFVALMLGAWYSAGQPLDSPGATLKFFQTQTMVFLNEIELNPPGEDAGFQWIELFNADAQAVDVSDWLLMVDVGQLDPLTLQMPQGTVLQPGQFFVQAFPDREPLPLENVAVELCDVQARVMDQTPTVSDSQDDDRCWARAADGSTEWQFKTCTQGTSNASQM